MEASTTDTAPGGSSFAARLDRYFDITVARLEHPHRDPRRRGHVPDDGLHPVRQPADPGLGRRARRVKLPFDQLLTVTALVAAVATLAMGIYGRYPFALAAGLGINAFVAFSLVGADRLSWPDAMGVVVAEGLIITVLVLVGFREAVINAIPHDLKLAIGIGIGLFITIIGLVDAGIVIKGQGTVVTIAPKLNTWAIAIFVIGLFGTYAMVARRVRGALLFGILGTTLLATIVNEAKDKKVFPNGSATWPDKIFATPDFSLVGNFSLHFVSALGFWSARGGRAVGAALGLLRHRGHRPRPGAPRGARHARRPAARDARVLMVDSLAAAGGGAASASSNTTFIESSAGIGEGARTGLASVVTGLLFACCLFISPLAGIIPSAATAPILVIVGAMMFELVRHLEWRDPVIALPVLLTIVLMPMTYSITNGVGAGFVSYSVLTLLGGRRVHPLMLAISAVFVWYFIHGVV